MAFVVAVGVVVLVWPTTLRAKDPNCPCKSKSPPAGRKVTPKPPVRRVTPVTPGGKKQGVGRGTPRKPTGGKSDPQAGKNDVPSWPVSGGDVADWWKKVTDKVKDKVKDVGDTLKGIEDGLRGKNVLEDTVRGAIEREEKAHGSKKIQKTILEGKLQRLESEKNDIAFDKIPNTASEEKRTQLDAKWEELHKQWLAVLGRIRELTSAMEQHERNIERQRAILKALKKAVGF